MHPILLFNPSLTLKIIVAAITLAALILFIRSYWKNGKLSPAHRKSRGRWMTTSDALVTLNHQ